MSRIDASASDKRSRETPHARGEDALIAEASVLSAETPPRMWGRQCGVNDMLTHPGNTPTHVGKTPAYCV